MAKKKRKKIWIYNVLIAICGVVFLVSGGLFARDLIRNRKQEAVFEEIAELFPSVPAAEPEQITVTVKQAEEPEPVQAPDEHPLKERISAEAWKEWWQQQAVDRFPVYEDLAKQNPDFIGWVRIEGTVIDYPVCQTPDDPEYYLHRDINRRDSSYGTPFLDAACRLSQPRSSLLIYGHHMKNGRMFATLRNYTSRDYYMDHPYIQFDMRDEAGSYEIAAVIRLDAEGTQVPWQQVLFPSGQEEFENAWKIVQKRKFYDTGIDVEYGEEILALVTCEYTQKNGRLMVIARKIL